MEKFFTINFAVLNLNDSILFDHFIRYLHKYNIKNILIIKYKKLNINFKLLREYQINYKVTKAVDKNSFYKNLKNNKNLLPNFFFSINGNNFIDQNLFDLQKLFKKNPDKFIYFSNNFINPHLYVFDRNRLNFYEKIDKKFFPEKYCVKLNYKDKDLFVLKKKNSKDSVNKFFNRVYCKSIILDRDGVLNKDFGYVSKVKDFKWIKGAVKAIKYLNNKKYNIFVASNQSGVARGYYEEKDVQFLHQFIKTYLQKRSCYINQIYYSPFHINGVVKRYKKNSFLRKPKIGMYSLIKKQWNVNSKKICMIGDQKSDIEFAKNCKIKGLLFKEKNLFSFIKKNF
jgi:D-glycero-D-manno-heptose 1,7-bisphosphate phosphatase